MSENDTLLKIAEMMRKVQDDCRGDALAIDGKEFNGRVVAELFGNTLAMVAAVAKAVELLAASPQPVDGSPEAAATEPTVDCPTCDGKGWYSSAEHDIACDGGASCARLCPVEVQNECRTCGGSGQVAAALPAVDAATQVDRIPSHRSDELPHYIQINRLNFRVDAETLTGAQIRYLPAPVIGDDYDLFQHGGASEQDRIVRDDEVVNLRGARFFTVPKIINAGAVDAATEPTT